MITIPTLNQLYTAIKADLEAEYQISIPIFGKNFLRAMAGVQAAKLKLYYLAIGNLQKNIFVDTADPESIGGTLERFGRVKLGRNPFPATAAQYTIQVTGSIGAIIPASSTFKSNDDSNNPDKLFVLDAAYQLTATTDTILVRALEAGLDSQLNIADELTATAPIANVDSIAEVTIETVVPLAAEDIEVYRQKVIDAYQLEPQGGAATDYRLWSADAQGVLRVYPYATPGQSNEIDLYVEATIADSTDGKGTPSAQLLLDVEAVVELDPDTTKPINDRGRRPLGVFQINYTAVTIDEVDIEITGYVGIDAPTQAIIDAALEAEIAKIRPFVAAADLLTDKNDILSINKVIFIIQSAVPGAVFTSLDLQVNNVSVSTYTFIDGNIPHVNPTTYV